MVANEKAKALITSLPTHAGAFQHNCYMFQSVNHSVVRIFIFEVAQLLNSIGMVTVLQWQLTSVWLSSKLLAFLSSL